MRDFFHAGMTDCLAEQGDSPGSAFFLFPDSAAFRLELAEFLSKGRKLNAVYQLMVGLYPLASRQED